MTQKISDLRVVLTSLIVSISDVVLNLVVAFFTGSTVMLSQALQGLSDLITGGILYQGTKRSKRSANDDYQFGFGREVFFWVLMAGIIMFVGTGGLSLYFGYQQFINPGAVEHVWVAFIMLVIGLVSNGYAFSLSFRRFEELDSERPWYQQLITSSIAETKATFIIDLLGTLAAVLGLISLGLFAITGNAQFDGLGSMLIGLMMMTAAMLLIHDMRGLIVGKSVNQHVRQRIMKAARQVDGVVEVLDLRTMHLGSAKLLVILEVHLQDNLVTDQIEQVVDEIKHAVQQANPEVHHIQVEVETPENN